MKNGQNWSEMVKNGGPDLKQARRTGLSARRARRTKSRGPKGLQPEVGARRAPRLLVVKYSYSKMVKDSNFPYHIGLKFSSWTISLKWISRRFMRFRIRFLSLGVSHILDHEDDTMLIDLGSCYPDS